MIDFREKEYLREIKRVRIPENRNLASGLRLNRNERVENWPKAMLQQIIADLPDHALSVYPDSSELYTAISDHVGVSEESILLTNGIDGAIKTLFEVLLKEHDSIGVLSPTYAMYQVYSDLFKVELTAIGYDMSNLSLDTQSLEEFIKKSPRLLFVPNPNQPIETPLDLEAMTQIVELASKYNTIVVFDEAYYYFGAQSAVSLIDKYANVIVLRTFSKAFGVPSIRLGYVVSNSKNMEVISKTRTAYESNTFTDAIALHLLNNFNLVEQYIERVIQGRQYLVEKITDLGLKARANCANYVLIEFEDERFCQHCTQGLFEHDIYVKGNYSGPLSNYMLVTCGPVEIMDIFINTLSELISAHKA